MAMAIQQSAEPLCAEILETARHECDEILDHARTEAAKVLNNGRAEADKIRRERGEQAKAEAVRRKERILGIVAVETGRLRSARIETLLESIQKEIRSRLLERRLTGRDTAVALAAEAIRKMPENDLVVEISGADLEAIGSGLAEEIIRTAQRSSLNLTISTNGVTGAGVLIRDQRGMQVWDNRLLSRLDRLWPELRRQIAMQTSLAAENHSTGGKA